MLQPFDRDYFKALIILLPGFLSYQLMGYFGEGAETKDFEIIAISLAFSIVNYFLTEVVCRIKGLGSVRENTEHLSLSFITLLLAVSLLTGWSSAAIKNKEFVLRHLSPSPLASDNNPLVTVLKECWPVRAKIQLSDDRIYRGILEYYSFDNDDLQLVLHHVTIQEKSGNKTTYNDHNQRLIVFKKNIISMEIRPVNANACETEESVQATGATKGMKKDEE